MCVVIIMICNMCSFGPFCIPFCIPCNHSYKSVSFLYWLSFPSLPPSLPPCTGYDRLLAMLCQSSSLRDVITFPKSFYGKDLFTGAPSELSPWQLSEYNIHQIDSNND